MERRRIGWGALLALLAAWVVAGVVGAFVGYRITGGDDDAYSDATRTLVHDAVPALCALAVAVAAITWLRWWQPVLRDDGPARGWAWAIPLGLALLPLLLLDRQRVSDAGPALIGSLVVTVLLVASSEELAFRGLALIGLRDRYPELVAALLSTLLFGAAHMLDGGFSNIGQGVLTFLAGFLYYTARRVGRGIALAIVIHAWWDFCAFSGELGPGSASGSSLFEVAIGLLVLVAVALGGWRLWQPRTTPAA